MVRFLVIIGEKSFVCNGVVDVSQFRFLAKDVFL